MEEKIDLSGARVYSMEKVEIRCSDSLFELTDKNAHATERPYISQICRTNEEVNKDKIYFCDFESVCWPEDGKGSLEKALMWADEKDLEKISVREYLFACGKSSDLIEDLKLDIIRLVLAENLSEKEYYVEHAEGMQDPWINSERKEDMNTGDHWFIFKKRK